MMSELTGSDIIAAMKALSTRNLDPLPLVSFVGPTLKLYLDDCINALNFPLRKN